MFASQAKGREFESPLPLHSLCIPVFASFHRQSPLVKPPCYHSTMFNGMRTWPQFFGVSAMLAETALLVSSIAEAGFPPD